MQSRFLVFVLLLGLASARLSCACDKPPCPDPGEITDFAAAATTRSFQLASATVQAFVGDSPFYHYNLVDLAADVDVILIHQDFFGLPWQAFAAATDTPAPPDAWVQTIDALATWAHTSGKPIFLSLAVVQGDQRHFLADDVEIVDGKVTPKPRDDEACPDVNSAAFADVRRAYPRYVEWMVQRFSPVYLNLGAEMNMFSTCGDPAWSSLVSMVNSAYDRSKSIDPEIRVFPSIQLDWLYGYSEQACPNDDDRDACYERNYAALANLKRDRFAISTYPYQIEALQNVADVPNDWFSRAAQRGGEAWLIAETGWNARTLSAHMGPVCADLIVSCEAQQQAYLQRLFTAAQNDQAEIVTWWSNRDLIPVDMMDHCGCLEDGEWCDALNAFKTALGCDASGLICNPAGQFMGEALFKAFGAMGIREYDGTARPEIFSQWQATLALPLSR